MEYPTSQLYFLGLRTSLKARAYTKKIQMTSLNYMYCHHVPSILVTNFSLNSPTKFSNLFLQVPVPSLFQVKEGWKKFSPINSNLNVDQGPQNKLFRQAPTGQMEKCGHQSVNKIFPLQLDTKTQSFSRHLFT